MVVCRTKNVASCAKIALIGETEFEVGPLVVKPAESVRPEI